MSEGFTCCGCGNLFFQAPKCVTCGAQKLYDSTVKLQGKEIEAQAFRIETLEAALRGLDDMIVDLDAGHRELHEVSRFINGALEGGKR